MTELEKLANYLMLFIIEYNLQQTQKTPQWTLEELKLMSPDKCFEALNTLITESQASGYSTRQSLLKYTLEHIKVLMPILTDDTYSPEKIQNEISNTLKEFIHTLKTLLDNNQSKAFDVLINDTKFTLFAFKRFNLGLRESLSFSGAKIHEILEKFDFHKDSFTSKIDIICSSHAEFLEKIQVPLEKNKALEEELKETKKQLKAAEQEIKTLTQQLSQTSYPLGLYRTPAQMAFFRGAAPTPSDGELILEKPSFKG